MPRAKDDESNPVARSFGTVLRRRRDGLRLSQEKLAGDAEIDRTYVSMMERGIHQPSLDVFIRVARALGVAPEALMAELTAELPGEP